MASPATEPHRAAAKPPNLLILITDQQRQPRHWPDEPGWLRELMPERRRARPHRAQLQQRLLQHGDVLAEPGDAVHRPLSGRARRRADADCGRPAPGPRQHPGGARGDGGILRHGEAPPGGSLPQFARGALGLDRSTGGETELPTGTADAGDAAARARLPRRLQGQVAPHPSLGREDADGMLGGWTQPTPSGSSATTGSPHGSPRMRARTRRRATSAAATPASARAGTRSTRGRPSAGSRSEDLPEPFCLVVSLVNPHDVLGYPAQYEDGGYLHADFRDLGVELPPTFDETLRDKPAVHALMRMGMAAYLGPLSTPQRAARLRQLLRPPAPHRRREDRPHPRRARRPRQTPARCARAPSSSAAPTTARWASRTAVCDRRPSTPTRRRSTCRSSSPTRCSSREAAETDALRLARRRAADAAQPQRRRRGPADGLRGSDLTPVLAPCGARPSASGSSAPPST